jgi:hypothetical protein
VDVQGLVGFHERRIQIAVFDPVPATAEEVAGSTVFTAWPGNALGRFVPFGRMIGFLVAFEYRCFLDRVAGTGRKFFVRAGLFVTDEAVDFSRVGKIETPGVFPSVAGMA